MDARERSNGEASARPGEPHWDVTGEKFDASLASAMHGVPLPPGLAGRIMDRLRQQRAETLQRAGITAVKSPAAGDPEGRREGWQQGWIGEQRETGDLVSAGSSEHVARPGRHRADGPVAQSQQLVEPSGQACLPIDSRRGGRRRWIAGLAAAAASLALAMFASRWFEPTAEVWGPERVMDAAREAAMADPGNNWPTVNEARSPARYPIPGIVHRSGTPRWRKVEGDFLGRWGAVYQLASPTRARAVLYVLKLKGTGSAPRLQGLPKSPPRPLGTANRTTAAWTDGQRLYVMVVQGTPRDYYSFFRRPDLA